MIEAQKTRAVYWLDGEGWQHHQSYLPGTNVLRTQSSHQEMEMELEQRAAAVGDALLIGVSITCTIQAPVRLLWELQLFDEGQRSGGWREPALTSNVLVVHRHDPSVSRMARPRRPAGAASTGFKLSLASGSLGLLLLGLGGPDVAGAQVSGLRERLARSGGWPAELAPPPLSGATRAVIVRRMSAPKSRRDSAKECYARSILAIAQLTDRSGALLASPPRRGGVHPGSGSAPCWLRDGAFMARALDVVGERGAARAFFEWALERQPPEGIWGHRYHADGAADPRLTERQLDETGAVLWALDRHLDRSFDERLQSRGLKAALAACQGLAAQAGRSGWPPVSYNVWGNQHGCHLYTLATLLAAIAGWRRRAVSSNDASSSEALLAVEDRLGASLAIWPVSDATGALARAVLPAAGGMITDLTPDISLIGLSVPLGVVSPADSRLQATVRAIEDRLLLPSNRVLRFGGDQDRGERPWPLAGLWLAWHYAATGQPAPAIRLYDRVLADRTQTGLIAEQVDSVTGRPCSTVPRPWAHAWFLLVTHSLLSDPNGQRTDVDYWFDNGSSAQQLRRERALEGGLYHRGLPERLANGNARIDAITPAGLRPQAITADLLDGGTMKLEAADGGHDGRRWQTILPSPSSTATIRYRLRADGMGQPRDTIWATDDVPRAEGQEFAYEPNPPGPPDWTADAIGYHIMVDRFARTGGEAWPSWRSATDLYGGTFDGIREHLDHLISLGVNLLWLSPVFVSPSHHGYDQDDHFQVEPRYGGEQALKRLVQAAHSSGMRVLLDYVPNHTGRGHQLFRRALQDAEAATVYRFWQWPHYYDTFFDHVTLPEIDTSRAQVQDYLLGVARRWMQNLEVDGLRCDHVSGVDTSFWIKLRRAVRDVNGSAFLLGEVSGSDDEIAAYSDRLDGVIDFGFARLLRGAFGRGDIAPSRLARLLAAQERRLAAMTRATFIDNHDMKRFLWVAGGDKARLKLAAVALLTLPGMPMLYYGSEVGLSQRTDGDNAQARMPMPWGVGQDHELLGHFQQLGQLRRSSLALRRGRRTNLFADEAVYAYQRSLGDEHIWILLNFSAERQVRSLRTRESPAEQVIVDHLNTAAIVDRGTEVTVELPPLAAAVLSRRSRGGGD